MRLIIATYLASASLLSFLPGGAIAQSADPAAQASPATAPDNTKSNKEDSTNRYPTADDQKNNRSDLEIAQQIRRGLMDDKSLSTYAHNAKVVSVNGTVTLNGVVKTQAEKSAVERTAVQVVGAGRVVNNLKVDADH